MAIKMKEKKQFVTKLGDKGKKISKKEKKKGGGRKKVKNK